MDDGSQINDAHVIALAELLEDAARRRMDMVALVPQLSSEVEGCFERLGPLRRSLTARIESILNSSVGTQSRVRIMLWNRVTSSAISRSLLTLAKGPHGRCGTIDIRAAGSRDLSSEIVPFVLLYDLPKDEWALWLQEKGSAEFPSATGMVMSEEKARQLGPKLLQFFTSVFNAADREPNAKEMVLLPDA